MSTRAIAQQATEFPPFTEEHDMIRRTVRRFAEEEIQPYAEKWDEEGIFPREIFRKAGELGLFGIRIDPKWGGAGLDWWASTAYYEGMAFSDSGSVNMALMVQSDLTIPVIQELGTEAQKAEFLPPAIRGEWIGSLGISEPGGGSDVGAIKTRAVEDGDDL